jgi:hypothetical protein
MKCKSDQHLRQEKRNQPALITMANSRLCTKGTSTKALTITSIIPIPALYYTCDTSIAYWSCIHRIIVKVWAREAPAYASLTMSAAVPSESNQVCMCIIALPVPIRTNPSCLVGQRVREILERAAEPWELRKRHW